MKRSPRPITNSLLLLVSLLGIPGVARAQTTAQQLVRAESLYDNSSFEAARLIFLGITTSKLQVSTEQRVTAYKFLGASYAVLSQKDSAVSYFSAALDNDPFTDLDLKKFGPDEQAAFAEAKKRIFKAAIAEILPQVIDPQSTRPESSTYVFRFVTTHIARVQVDLILRRDTMFQEHLYNANNEGAREVAWRGLIQAQRADTGLYDLRVTATDATPGLSQATAVATREQPSVLLRIEHVFEPLEDSLPALTPDQLLVSRYGRSAPLMDFGKGALVAALAFAMPRFALNREDLPGWTTHASVGIGLGLAGGAIAAWFGARNPNIPDAVAENDRKQRQHDAFNAAIRQRNAARKDKTILILRPLTGAGG